MAKQLLHGDEARRKLFDGIDTLTRAVRATMGPKGRNALMDNAYGGPVATNDGVTIAREITLEDKFENMGAMIIKQAAGKTNDVAGDGTTTATVLAHAIIKEGMKHTELDKSNPMLLKKGIESAVKIVLDELDGMKKDVTTQEEMKQVATISSQNDEIGDIIAEVFEKVGVDGVVQVEDSAAMGISINMTEGMQFDNGCISPYMVTDKVKMEAIHESAAILVTDLKINDFSQILPLINEIIKAGKKNLVIIADTIQGNALQALVVNTLKGSFVTLAIKAPGFGARRKEMLKDVAVMTGASFISEEKGDKIEKCSMASLGSARRVVSTQWSTTIVEGGGSIDRINERVDYLKREIKEAKSDFDKDRCQERLAKLTGGIAMIQVGALTEIESKEKMHRVEDALSATRAAMQEGIVIGGGAALAQASLKIDPKKFSTKEEQLGAAIVKEALEYPVKQIAENAGYEGDKVLVKLLAAWADKKLTHGFDANTPLEKQHECIVDMFEAGIIDPKKVTRSALENAASVASMFLTTETAIVDAPAPEQTVKVK